MPRIRLLVLSTLFCASAHAELRCDWADDFSAPERARLIDWIERTADGLESLSWPPLAKPFRSWEVRGETRDGGLRIG
jgi:hypothetical protein